MNWAQYALTGYLAWLLLAGLITAGIDKYNQYVSPPKKAGAMIGFTLRYGTIFYLLYAGGFYN